MRSKPVEHPAIEVSLTLDKATNDCSTHFRTEETSMIRGMSSENPADERLLCILHIWSAYEVTGEVTMKTGAMCVITHFTSDMAL